MRFRETAVENTAGGLVAQMKRIAAQRQALMRDTVKTRALLNRLVSARNEVPPIDDRMLRCRVVLTGEAWASPQPPPPSPSVSWDRAFGELLT